MHTEQQIKDAIKTLPTLDTDNLIHQYKCASSRAHKVYKPLIDAIQRELNKRRKVSNEETPETSTEEVSDD